MSYPMGEGVSNPGFRVPLDCSWPVVSVRMIEQAYDDAVVLNALELSQNMRVSRWTIYRWRSQGYKFEFGNLTTTGHLKAWLRTLAETGGPPPDEHMTMILRKMGRC
jgi:hypothetical protein